MSRSKPQPTTSLPRATLGWWWLLGLAGFLACGGVWLMMMRPNGGGAVPGWEPVGANDRVLDTFVSKVNERDQSALELLGPEPVFDDEPVSEKEAEVRQTAYCLRRPQLRIDAIRRGEPGKRRKKGDPPRSVYTLTTRVRGSTPPLRIRDEKGNVGSPSRLFVVDLDLVVEVKDGKVHGVRTAVHQD